VVEKLVIMNAPHPLAFRNHFTSSLSQLAKSWYIFYFQLPFVSEEKIRRYTTSTLSPSLRELSSDIARSHARTQQQLLVPAGSARGFRYHRQDLPA
jgi:hypothetical protein